MKPIEPQDTFYWVVFHKTLGRKAWWQYLLKDEFGHCFALRDVNGKTLVINHILSGTHTQVFDMPAQEFIEHCAPASTAVIGYMASHKNKPFKLRWCFSCVTIIKSLLAIDSLLSFTPFMLYKWLMLNGAVVVKPWAPYMGD